MKRRSLYYRRRRGRRPLMILGSALVVGLIVAAVVAAATKQDTSTNRDPATVGASTHAGHAAPHKPATVSTQLSARESRAIDSVLRYTPFVSVGLPRHRVIALTFDDGPSPYTPMIVSELLRLHVPATFFIVGQQLNDFSVYLRDELTHGFVVGDHTENHAWLSHLTASGQYGQIHDAAVRVRHDGGPFPRLFRPPYGVYNRSTLATLKSLGMLMVLWSIDPGDWRRPGTQAIVTSVLAHAKPGGIVELHDGGGDRSQTVAALPAIVKALRKRHYEFVTVPELLALDPPPHHQQLPTLTGA